MIEQILTLITYGLLGCGIGFLLYKTNWHQDQKYLFLFFIYAFTSIIVSCIYLSLNKTYVTETGRVSEPSFAWLFYFSMDVIIFLGARTYTFLRYRIGKGNNPDWRRFNPHEERITLLLLGAILLVELFNVAISHPNGFDGEHIDRARFFETTAKLSFLPNLFGVLAFFIPVAGGALLFTSPNKNYRIIAGIYIALYFVYLRGVGQVFHGMLFPASVIGAIYLSVADHKMARFKIPIKTTAIFFIVAVTLVVVNNFAKRGISSYLGGPLEGIIYRMLVLQGSAADAIYKLWESGASMSFDDVLAGRDYWINNTMAPSLASSFMEAGVNLQGAVPGTFLLFGGLVGGAILCFVYGIFLAMANDAMLTALRRGALLALFPASYLWVWTFGVYSRASLEEVVKPKVLIMLILYFGLLKLGRRSASSKLFRRSPPLAPGGDRLPMGVGDVSR